MAFVHKNKNNMSEKYGICYSCESVYKYNGWYGLCNKKCYHDLTHLYIPYEFGISSKMDSKLIKYFLKYPKGGSLYMIDAIQEYIDNLSEEEINRYMKEINVMNNKLEEFDNLPECFIQYEEVKPCDFTNFLDLEAKHDCTVDGWY